MKNTKTLINLLLIISFAYSGVSMAAKGGAKPEMLTTNADSGFYISDAAYFKADGIQAVVFVPGFIFNKESWFKLAKPLQKYGVASVALSGKTVENVKTGIQFLKDKGFKEIILVGGSSGAAAVLKTLNDKVDGVTKVVTLSAVRGNPIADKNIKKLFVVSKGEKSFPKVKGFYEGSTEPKSLKVFEGKKHAQFLFFSPHKDGLNNLIKEFILNE